MWTVDELLMFGTVHPKEKIIFLILISFQSFCSSVEHKKRHSEDLFPCNCNEQGLES